MKFVLFKEESDFKLKLKKNVEDGFQKYIINILLYLNQVLYLFKFKFYIENFIFALKNNYL